MSNDITKAPGYSFDERRVIEPRNAEVPENFADHPESIAEVRSEKSQNAADWTPRDALISVLRALDRGEIAPDTMVICHSQTTGSKTDSFYSAAAPNALMSIGTVQRALYRMNVGMDDA